MSMMEYIERILAIIGGLAGIAGLYLALKTGWELRRMKREPTWDDSLRVAEKLLDTIDGAQFTPNLVIGLGRSGGIWGGWLAGNLGTLPFGVIDLVYTEDEHGRRVGFPGGEEVLASLNMLYKDQTQVLVVEGASSNGFTFQEFFKKFDSHLSSWEVRTAVLYMNVGAHFAIDFVGKDDLYPWPKKFPWHKRGGYKPHLRFGFERGVKTATARIAST